MRRPHDTSTDQVIAQLTRVGTAAIPWIDDDLRDSHLHAIRMSFQAAPTAALRMDAPRSFAPVWRSRRGMVAVAMAAFVAVPSMAFAGVLPDPVQRAASEAAAVVGVALPAPASDRAVERTAKRPAGAGAGTEDRSTAVAEKAADDKGQGHGRGEQTRGTSPGRPEPGEQRGNRFGQVEAGPDKGRAGAAHGVSKAPKPAQAPRAAAPAPAPAPAPTPSRQPPASPPAPAPETSVAPSPAPPAGGAVGNGGGNRGGEAPKRG